MTTITTILGVMPPIVWRDPLFYSLAIVIACGPAFGTLLTLGVAPVLYSIFFRVHETTSSDYFDRDKKHILYLTRVLR
jgi:hypothetical protein